MRPLCIDLTKLSATDLPLVGGKATALGRLASAGLPVPQGVCVTILAYEQYLDTTGLRQRLPLLLERKPFREMRWEELCNRSNTFALDLHPDHGSFFRPDGGFGCRILCRSPRLVRQCQRLTGYP